MSPMSGISVAGGAACACACLLPAHIRSTQELGLSSWKDQHSQAAVLGAAGCSSSPLVAGCRGALTSSLEMSCSVASWSSCCSSLTCLHKCGCVMMPAEHAGRISADQQVGFYEQVTAQQQKGPGLTRATTSLSRCLASLSRSHQGSGLQQRQQRSGEVIDSD